MLSPSSPPSIHSNYLVKKISLFDPSCRQILGSIIELVESQLETREEKKRQKIDYKFDESSINSLNLGDKITCSTCQCSFESRQEQIEHFRGDLHLYNLKQKIKGKPTVSIDEFENLSDISSISGSDTEEENIYESSSSSESEAEHKTVAKIYNQKNRPKFFFKLNDSTIISIYRSVLFSKKFTSDNQEDILAKIQNINQENKWCIILVAAGHFAAAVFKGYF
ncbi:ankyrin repeat and zinc finger domain-containing 1 isoform X1 [Brachionus plicatilis]|uniref:Ankyrin repeat and zinc finger domain-containing 1 isoform X1 n=1 Tax=Brachionus plicatilis TaxID=10195 RepID=A0A3M7Q0N5_BRAPC|nr:ankyrin repeat and zinc finger domain-containing 1 isoform X1 [Brachionus plicatilis]